MSPRLPRIVALSAAVLVGVGRLSAAKPVSTLAGPPGVVFVVAGVGGFDLFGTSVHQALPKAGVPHEIRDFTWTHGRGQILKDLRDLPYLLQKAGELAREIRRIKSQNPDQPIYLVGKSGGAGLVLAAAGQLPSGTLERVILLSAAVAPDYDLRPALRATRGELVSFYSPYDKLILGWGTRHFGTVDRYYGPSAGLHGFSVPPGLDDEGLTLYRRLIQIPWSPAMILEGNMGTHVGTSMPGFMSAEVARWLMPGSPPARRTHGPKSSTAPRSIAPLPVPLDLPQEEGCPGPAHRPR